MIKVNALTLELIDDHEYTPGYSRKFSEFRETVLPILKKEVDNKSIDNINIEKIGNFKFAYCENDVLYFKFEG